jgi:hypothetical protein
LPGGVPGSFPTVLQRYLTIEFNAFFAWVEQQECPELRGRREDRDLGESDGLKTR